ncbi:MAG: PSD1 and planctomycete cytochrome C domain-containing protein [Verrucomicrobiota bacterium]
MPRPSPSLFRTRFWCAALALSPLAAAESKLDFARDVQPILAKRCFDCHGADKAKGGLHLNTLAGTLKGGESREPALVVGHSAKSLLIQRITTDDENDVMPQKGDRLPPAEIATLKQWIDEGAVWPENLKHWAYVKPERPAVPPVADRAAAAHNPIDHFVLARLAQEKLRPSPPTDKSRWLRRVSLDLVGLPPTPAEIEAFAADNSAQAYARVVDRLLASPQYGERWARPWLDLARYADSHGFQKDDLRDLWPYRDWVIRAMNADMPFDQFTIYQIAGDLLPASKNPDPKRQTPNYDALIATGFHRSAPTNVEAGTDQEEGRVNQVFDRVNTTASVWLGSTLECAQCHNHKYDPFSQKDYYRLFAFFNNSPKETDFSGPRAMASLKFTGPYLTLPDLAKDKKRPALEAQIAELDRALETERAAANPRLAEWEKSATASLSATSQTYPLDVATFTSSGDSTYVILPDKSVLLTEDVPELDTYTITVKTTLTGITAFKLEALTDPSLPGTGPGRGDAARPNFILNSFKVTASSGVDAKPQPVALTKATASFSQARFEVENALKPKTSNRAGWAIGTQFFRDHWAIFETAQPVGSAEGTTFTFTLVQNFGTGRTIGRVRLSALTGTVSGPTLPAAIAAILRTPQSDRTEAQTKALAEHFYKQDKALDTLRLARLKVTQELNSNKGPQTLVMQELDQPRASTVMNRGSFLDPGEPVQPGTPAILHALGGASTASSAPPVNRLDLAKWLVDRENPLVARVTINRWWSEFFGRGLVSTPEDFGIKGEMPTHPELLDWLSVEFMEHGWSMKHIHRLIALSATYRQSSRFTPESLARDDQNKWLGRGPRFRLDAETIRDNALASAGLLSLKQGGAPVRPYQPAGLWESKVGGEKVSYDLSTGEDAYRRGIYTVWKRSSPYPSFMNFDATNRTACTVKRSRSNTPLQALTLLNDPVYVEVALALAQRVLTDRPDGSTDERIRHAFQLCLTRPPTRDETATLKQLYDAQSAAYASDPKAAAAIIAGKRTPPANLTPAELAAWQAVATAIINLDEMITKG